jgi:hypothetical protein
MLRTLVVAGLTFSLVVPTVQAQSVLQTPFKKKYSLKSVACESCHIKTEDKDQHPLNDFGKILAKLLEGKNITPRLNAVEKADEAAKDKVKEEVCKEFLEALKKLDGMKAPSGKTWEEAIKAGELEGAKPRK